MADQDHFDIRRLIAQRIDGIHQKVDALGDPGIQKDQTFAGIDQIGADPFLAGNIIRPG